MTLTGIAKAADSRSHVVADQGEVFAFLADPATYRIAGPVTRIDTHGAAVFLAGAFAYKVKRAVRFPFMDFSTLAKRKEACEAEIAVNGPNAAGLYLGAVAIMRTPHGLRIGDAGAGAADAGKIVEWAVKMRRFDENATLDHVAARHGLSRDLLRAVAHTVAISHEAAPLRPGAGAVAALSLYLDQNEEAFRADPGLFAPAAAERIIAAGRSAHRACEPLLLARGEAGFVRRCHGDLHLRNIVLIEDKPTLFDAIEFSETIATTDVLYDLSFLIMDLCERGLREAANVVLNRYLWETDARHLAGLAAMPLFLSLRASIRAKVIAAGLAHLADAARAEAESAVASYFRLAGSALDETAPCLIAVGGLSGSGKSTLAEALAPILGRTPGAVHLRSDIERKRLHGVSETERLPAEAYTATASRAVYAELERKAEIALEAGAAVVVDAVYARPDEREAIARIAKERHVAFVGLWLDAPERVLTQRVDGRLNDASDATAAVVREQVAYDLGAMGWERLDASPAPAAVRSEALCRLEALGIRT